MQTRCILIFLLLAQVRAISQITFCMVTSERPVSYLERVLDTFREQRVNDIDGVGVDCGERGRYKLGR